MITLSGVFVIPPKRLLKHFSACSTLINPLTVELNPICHLLALLAHHIFHVSGLRVKCYLVRVEQAAEIEIYVYQYLLRRMKQTLAFDFS